MVSQIRNRGCIPDVRSEGVFTKPLPGTICLGKGSDWYKGLSPYDRCFAHQTLASVRRYAHFKPFRGLIPEDELDLILASPYNHTADSFPDPGDPYLQSETLGVHTWRRLQNTHDMHSARTKLSTLPSTQRGTTVIQYHEDHPVLIGGIREREHPSHVKLMNSSHHSPQTNGGYTRQDGDGNHFHY